MALNWHSPEGSGVTRLLLTGGTDSTRRALGDVLTARPTIALAGAAPIDDAIEAAVETRPSVVLIDARLPDVSAVLASRAIRSNLQGCQTLLLSTSADLRTVAAVALSGACGHVLKSLDLAPLRNAVEAAGTGRMHLDRRFTQGLLDWFGQRTVPSSDGNTLLSLAEEDMALFADIVAGRLDSDIAYAVGRSVPDVQGDVTRLYEALHGDPGFRAPGNALARWLRVPGEQW